MQSAKHSIFTNDVSIKCNSCLTSWQPPGPSCLRCLWVRGGGPWDRWASRGRWLDAASRPASWNTCRTTSKSPEVKNATWLLVVMLCRSFYNVEMVVLESISTVLIGYCDYHLVTKIGYWDYSNPIFSAWTQRAFIALWQILDIVTILLCPEGTHNIR